MEKVVFPQNAPLEALSKSSLIKDWISRLSKEIDLIEARVVDVSMFGRRVGFVEIDADYLWKGEKRNERFFLSGKSVFIAVLFKTEDPNNYYTVLVKQPRIACGKQLLEFPAGMTDDSTNYREVAIRELEEECGIVADDCELNELDDFLNTSQLISDDMAKVFFVVKNESLENVKKLENTTFGADEDEVITLKVHKLEDVPYLTEDLVTKCAALELLNMKKDGKL